MTDRHVSQGGLDHYRTIRTALDFAQAGDTILVHEGLYPERIDTYETPVRGGSSWSTKLTIRAYKPRGKPPERVVLRPEGGQYVVRFAEAVSQYIELRNLDLDASLVELMAIKLSRRGGLEENAASHIRFVECDIHGALHSGAHDGNETGIEIIRCRIFDNGTRPESAVNLDHGLYLGGPGVVVRDCDAFRNGASGIKLNNGAANTTNGARVSGNRCTGNGARGRVGAGILVSTGKGARIEGNYVAGNDIGIQVNRDAVGAYLGRNLLGPCRPCLPGQTTGRIYIAPEAVASTVLGAGIDANLEV